MTELRRLVIEPDPRCRAPEVGLFLAQLEDLHATLARTLEGVSPQELSWQLHAGANTIAMLVTHIAIAQVHLTDIGVRRMEKSDIVSVLGMDEKGDGMPLPPGADPPGFLAGRTEADLLALLEKARAHTARFVVGLAESDLEPVVERFPAGQSQEGRANYLFNGRWVLHHEVEHLAGHLGQVQFLRAAYRSRKSSGAPLSA